MGFDLRLGNPDFGSLLCLGADFDLRERDVDAFGVIVWDEFGVADLVNERFASSSKVINVESFGRESCNSESVERIAFSNAVLARFFCFWYFDQWAFRSVLSEGVK